MTRTIRRAAAAAALALAASTGAVAAPAAAATHTTHCWANTPLDPTRPDYVHLVKVTYTDRGGPGSDVTSIRVDPEIRAKVKWAAFKGEPYRDLRIVGHRNWVNVPGGKYTSVGAPPANAFTEHLNVWFESEIPGPNPKCFVKIRFP